MVNIFFQEWAPLLPVVHRPSFLKLYEQFVSDASMLSDVAERIQLNLVFGIAATSNKVRHPVKYYVTLANGSRHGSHMTPPLFLRTGSTY